MTGQWEQIRRQARARRVAALVASGGDPSAVALLDAAARLTGVDREGVPAGNPLLDGGQAQFDPEAEMIWYNADLDPLLAVAYQAHEYGHLWQGDGAMTCTDRDLDAEMAEDPLPLGARRVEGYGPHERRELGANVFAREFLLPADAVRRWFLDEGLTATAIAERVGVLPGLVQHQLTRALLVPETPTDADDAADDEVAIGDRDWDRKSALDPSQAEAAYIARGPLLLEAGPGTGKTLTLVARIAHLLGRGAAPESILVLTFSNKAAEELRERVARVAPEAAPRIWTGTFHAYGLELLRKYGTRLGLPPKPTILGPVDALLLLERSLPALDLDHYQNLYEPTITLADILGAISRAKDELADPERYADLAAAMLAAATTDDQVVAAEKAGEVARVYRLYQRSLDCEGQLDFGDLIARAVELLRGHPEVRAAVRATHAHILVDEYQDVNRASAMLLREIAGDGRRLWVVGDIRQAIYRWRGAAPANMRLFEEDFPGAMRRTLARNYRSQPAIVDVVAALAPGMRVARGEPFVPWAADRALDDGEVLMHVADDADAECAGLAREIMRRRGADIPLRDQAILCRTHTDLARLGAGLERAGVPVLYLGDLFERHEVRDLLALLSLACEGDGRGLIRVARLPEYRIPLGDVRALRALAREREVPFPRALDLAADAPGLSPAGRAALAALAGHLEGLCYGTSAWGFLARYLFDRSDYLRQLADDESVVGLQRRAAIYQFLQFAHERRGESADGEDPKRSFLRHVRRLETFGEEKQLRRMPEWAADIDAVRLLTVHASKGLEFRAVYLPGLGQGRFPGKRRGQPCPPPVGLLPHATGDEHEEEEECLFFVALSRARDVLCLSRAARYGKQSSNPASILGLIAACLPHPPGGGVTWPATTSEAAPDPDGAGQPTALTTFEVTALDVYIDCPRRYFYEFVLGLGGRRDDAAYVQFHGCVYAVLRWLGEERSGGRIADETAALARLASEWSEHGPLDHAYEAIYRHNAEAMVRRAVGGAPWAGAVVERPTHEVILPHGRVRLTPDQVALPPLGSPTPPRIQRLRTGSPSKTEDEKNIYALYLALAEQVYPGTGATVETIYLSTDDEPHKVAPSQKVRATRLGRYDAAIVGILAGRYPALPDDRTCPRCPHYFICPLAEDS